MLRPRGNRLSTATRPLAPRGADGYGRSTRKLPTPPQYVGLAPAVATRLRVEDYAKMKAALVDAEVTNGVVSDEARAAILAPFGLDAEGERAEAAAWNARFKEDRFAFADYMQTFTRLRAEAEATGATARRVSAVKAAERARQQARVPPCLG